MFDPTFLLALAAAILGAASLVLHVVAPRTKNTIDDALRDDIDEVLAFIRGRPAPAKSSSPPTSTSSLALALIVVGAALAGSSSIACMAAQRTATGRAVIDCTAAGGAAIGEILTSMRGGCAPGSVTDWGCVRSKAVAAGLQIGGCAFLELVSAEPARVNSATGEPPAERPGRAAFESYRAAVAGGAAFRTAAGER